MKEHKGCIIPTMHYKKARIAIDWLCNAFGFEKHLVVEGDNNTIAHAQLTYGNAMIMLSSENENEYGKLVKTPEDLHGNNTQAPYIIVEQIDEHYKRAVAAGAKILIDIKDEAYGGRGYTCKDNEGYIWNFGSYNPWAENE
ncbi:VOC family protein [uncultured Tenacibaculum sp.]|uniref:VOC family protein n=1 Tax=uncultured Tenacibaculum sp. TaxID=174713 RepID=UPI002632F9E0|nr:VOC family protein [uncultured Tenacibaculum sp.]